ncbi:MAG: hypothetical protein AAGL98_14425, partial [Planctomycetota bacterium]
MILFSRIFTWSRVAVAAVGLGLWAGPAAAVVIQDTGGTLPAGLPTQALGTWGNNAGAIALGGAWVVTTRHQDIGLVDRRVNIDGQTYDALAENQVIPLANADLRLVRLTETATGELANLSSSVELYRGSVTGQTAQITGFGPTIGELSANGDGYNLAGPTGNAYGLNAGQNRIDRTRTIGNPFGRASALVADFDNAALGRAVDFEANLAGGDSGGGWFVQQDGQWRLAGITQGIQPPGANAQAEAFFGQEIYAVNLTTLADIIDATRAQNFIAGDYNGDDIVSQADLDLV